MWEVIKKVKGVPSDRIDLALNDMMHRTLKDEIIPFDEWQDLTDDIDEECEDAPDLETILQERGLTMPVLVKQANEARTAFLETLHRYDLPLEDRFALCQLLYERVKKDPSDELLRLYCDIISDGGFLLDIERAGDEGTVCWLSVKEDSDELYNHLSERAQMNARAREILEKTRKIRTAQQNYKAPPVHADEVFQLHIQIFHSAMGREKLLDNITYLLQAADDTEELAPIKPLFLYRVMTRHMKRLQTSGDLKIDFQALWNYQEYKLDKYNGKNYQTYARYLALFYQLCDIFSSDPLVDIPLCVCGFEQLSNLSEFYQLYALSASWGFEIAFAPPVEEFLEESPFSCFEHGYGDNVIMADNGISRKTLDRFQSGTDRRCSRALNRISGYMNKNIADLVTKFWGASPEEVKALCTEILEASALPRSQQPKTAQDTALFLASINGRLMEAVDYYADEYLTAIGEMFVNS